MRTIVLILLLLIILCIQYFQIKITVHICISNTLHLLSWSSSSSSYAKAQYPRPQYTHSQDVLHSLHWLYFDVELKCFYQNLNFGKCWTVVIILSLNNINKKMTSTKMLKYYTVHELTYCATSSEPSVQRSKKSVKLLDQIQISRSYSHKAN